MKDSSTAKNTASPDFGENKEGTQPTFGCPQPDAMESGPGWRMKLKSFDDWR